MKKSPAAAKRTRPESVEAYLESIPASSRAAIEKLRRAIRAAAPRATEVISYGIPAFRDGKLLVGYAAFEGHSSFFLMSTAVMRAHAAELAGYAVGKGSIRFSPDEPLPAALVKKLVKARIAENARKPSAAVTSPSGTRCTSTRRRPSPSGRRRPR